MTTINGTSGNDTLNGTSGADLIYGFAGNDTLNGGDGNDILDGGDGNDLIDGGAGIDTVSFASAAQYVWINLSVTWPYDTRGGGLDGITNVENIVGSNFDDRLTGDNGANHIDGGAGNDFIVGGAGADVLTGGSGNDEFLYQAGDGKDSITDFAAGDTVSFSGLSDPQSVTQVGNDVVVVFSATDQLTFLNTDVASIQDFLPHQSTFTQPPSTIIPALPTRPGSTTASATLDLSSSPSSTINAGQVYYGIDIDPTFGPYSTYFRAGWGSPLVLAGQLTNSGTIWDSSTVYDANAVWAGSVTNSGTIVAEVGPFDPPGLASMQYWFARAVAVGSSFSNSGSVFSIATGGGAIGVYTSGASATIDNSGLIAVQATYGDDHSQTGGAQGVRMDNGGHFTNAAGGQVLVDGDSLAYGLYQGRGSNPASDTGPEIVNRGLIQVVVGADTARAGIGIYAVNLPTELMRIVNSGTIQADIAIYAPSSPADTFTTSTLINAQTVTNEASGLIIGNIQLELGNDTLVNAGTIQGTVDMGGSDDLVNNSAGTIKGTVLLGDGNDTFIGGTRADYVRGGTGNDVISGGAARDLLEGDFGNDTLDGGAGSDGLYGGVGDDILRTTGGDVASGGYGNDRIETGDYSFARIDGGAGYDQWVLANGSRSFDLSSIAATGRVTGIEEIDLRANQTIVVRAGDIAAITGGDTIHLRGDSTDSIYLTGSWSSAGTVFEDGVSYAAYQSGGSTVLIESAVHVAIGAAPPAAGGLDTIASGPAAPTPDADANSNILSTSLFPVMADFVIGADEVWKSSDGAAVLAFAYQPVGGQPYDAPDIANYGQIINDVGTAAIANAVGGLFDYGSPNFGTFSNFGTIRAETSGSTTNALAFLAGSMGVIVNSGDIVAIAHGSGDATGISTFDAVPDTFDANPDSGSVMNQSGGYIGAYSESGFATGVFAANDTILHNDGLIEADGGSGAVGVDQFNAGGSLVNTGAIVATVAASNAASIGYAHFGFGTLENSGVISADIAVYFVLHYGETFALDNSGTIDGAIVFGLISPDENFGRFNLTNSGDIFGSILINPDGSTVDTIVNNGWISGDISLAAANDKYDGTNGSVGGYVDGGAGNDLLTGGAYSDWFYGGTGKDTLTGNGGNDILEGGNGDDIIDGGAGFDFASYSEASEGIDVRLVSGAQATNGAGTDTLIGIEGLIGSAFADTLTGDSFANTLIGNAGNDVLDGGAGNDQLIGGTGNDIYYVDSAGDSVVENAGEGADAVLATSSYVLGDNVEILTLIGASNINGTGNDLDNDLWGNAGNNILRGGAGNDTLGGGAGIDKMYGGVGDDTYIVSDTTDYAYELAGEGNDTVLASITTALRDNVENLVLTGTGDINGTGNSGANVMTGNDGANRFDGLDGKDTLYGGGGNDILNGGIGADMLYGDAGDDILRGGDGNDTLNGGAGIDKMYGGVGNDTYIVSDTTDYAYELAGEGNDTVLASITTKLRDNVENLVLTGTSNLNGTGNALDNVVTGNDGANRLYGLDGKDTLYGGAGKDILDGGAGNDKMYGGTGNDTYIVDSTSDRIFENAGEGTDTVTASATYTLSAEVENLTLAGTASINGTGNNGDNILTGNDGSNRLYGLEGNDTLYGGAGKDILDGGAGADKMYGGAGNDIFVFRDGEFGGTSASTADRISDFSHADGDRIDLRAVDANSSLDGTQAFHFLGNGAFTGSAGELRYQELNGNTYVYGDTNGDGIADFTICLTGSHTLASGDFIFG